MLSMSGRGAARMLLLGLVMVLAGCASKSVNRAPVEDRGTPGAVAPAATPPADTQAGAAKPLAGIENAGRPGYYTVKPGDTLIRIGLDNGQNWRDIARWNGLENPNVIEVGQTLRVIPPMGATPAATAGGGGGSARHQCACECHAGRASCACGRGIRCCFFGPRCRGDRSRGGTLCAGFR
jgi:LysM repeat protein